jgi:hypothetical protein
MTDPRTGRSPNVIVRLSAALLALSAGAIAIVLAILLLQKTIG